MGRAVPRKDLPFVLESALRMSNVALVHDAQGYRLIPTTEAVAVGSATGPTILPPDMESVSFRYNLFRHKC